MQSWPVEEAEARFGEMPDRCLADGPQVVTRDGAEAAVLVSAAAWERARRQVSPPSAEAGDLKEWLTTDFARHDIPHSERPSFSPRPVDFDD